MNTERLLFISARKRLFAGLAVMLTAFLMISVGGCRAKEEKAEEVAVLVSVMEVETGPMEDVLRFTADVRARRDVKLLSQVGERIIALHADKGDRVREGDLLAVIDHTLLSHGVAQAEAAAQAARSSLANLEIEYRRAERLVAEEAISRQQYDARKTQYESAQSAVAQAEAALEQVRRQYRNAFIRAPFSGVISNRFVELGDMVAPGAPVFGLVQMDAMRVLAQVSEHEFARIVPGQKARLQIASLPDRIFEGRVAKKMPILDPVSRLATVEVSFSNPEGLLVAGMFGDLEIIIDRKEQVPRIPVSALRHRVEPTDRGDPAADGRSEQFYVFVVENKKAARRDVVTGYRQQGLIEIVSGVKAGELLVVRGHHAVEDGGAVEIARGEEADMRGERP
ncbi:MAG TPA: efflux RND transporter periplasmic adaptor subunit [Smithellaceae bacterium]|nr:efflux RND transporter periplasmic adaptor subunit [Smithellaceae bacterium]